MMSTANTMARAMAMNCDGLHTKALLADNARSAREAREMAAAVGQIEAEYDATVSWGLMTLTRRGAPLDYCVVAGHISNDGELTVAATTISEGNPLPLAAFETAALNRCVRNRDARLAAEAAAREAEAAQGAPQ